MKRFAGVSTVLIIAVALCLNAAFQQVDQVEVARLDKTNWEAFAPKGKEVDAIYGDYVLRNEHLTAVIAQPLASRNANMTVRDVGGCLIDLTVRHAQSDQLSAFYPGARAFPYRSSEVLDAKGNGINLPLGASNQGDRRSVRVQSKGTGTRPTVLVTYSLSPGVKYLDVTSKYTNETDSPMTVPLEDDMRIDSRNEDILKAPNGTEKLYWVHDRHWGQAYGFEAPGFAIASDSNSRTSTLRYESAAANRKVMLPPGKSFELKRRVFPATDLPDVRAIAAENAGETTYPLRFHYTDASDRPIAGARITLRQDDAVWGSVVTGPDGRAKTRVPKGTYSHSVEVLGLELGSDFKDRPKVIDGTEGQVALVGKLPNWNPGTVKAEFTDAVGKPIPCKVEFFAKDTAKQFSWGPQSSDFRVQSLRYAPRGTFEEMIPPGDYEVIIAHGPEYDAIFTDLTVPAGKTVSLTGKLKRVVDTTGWISSDFHSHSSPSGDNTGSQLGRILNLAADHIEFAPCTEHNRIDTYQPHIDRLNIGEFMGTCTGMELTGSPLLLNHQNAFPLKHKPHLQDGGGPVTDTDVEKQIERLSRWDDNAEKLLQINHPDFGWMFRDRNGDGEPDEGHPRILPHIDVVEIHPVPDILTLDPEVTASTYKGNNRIFNWLQMLNQGRRFVGVVNTDAHYNYHESGWLRNWLKSPTDDPAKVKPLDIVRAAEAGALIMSNGPFLEVSMREAGSKGSVIGGQDLEAKSGKVEIDVRVQCPNWLDIDRVFVLVNGRIDKKHHYRKATSPNMFRSGVVKFEEKLQLELKEDAHLIVVTGADGRTLGKIHGPTWGQHHPAAFHNPVFVDIDGKGFKPNGDTLGHPLPVKFGARKQ
ncbi:MAG: CehA/McbA family metallohydrolase [Planctomycetota bacterium]|nr:CehA/McbA family metallohydrolase [Planctomycetota bacterium]MDA1247587.1 CehA/McbA family metallohydrolase [Planctomycetota bacterium]